MPEILQIPDPDLAKDIGVVAWLLMAVTVSGASTIGFFLWRITQAMDRMATAQESVPTAVTEMKTLLVERFTTMQTQLDRAVELAEEHVRIGRLWEKTESVGRQVRGRGTQE